MMSRICSHDKNMATLPAEILTKIFSFCDQETLQNIAKVNIRFSILTSAMQIDEQFIMHIECLPSELLLKIFSHLDRASIGCLAQVNRRFRELGHAECLWVKSARESLVTNGLDKDMEAKTLISMNARDRVRISKNWVKGIVNKLSVNLKVLSQVMKCMVIIFGEDVSFGEKKKRKDKCT